MDTAGLHASDVEIPASDGAIPGYCARPDGDAKYPVVLVIQEIFGVNAHMKDVCRRFARVGYMAIAPELYARQGDVSQMTDHQEIIAKVVSKAPDAQVNSDLDAAVVWAEKEGHGDTSRLGLVGFCWGGRAAWLYSAHSDRLKAAGAFYGQLAGAVNEYRTRTALDAVADLKAPVMGFYGGKDHGIPIEQVHQMQEALNDAGKDSIIMVYPDAGHAFFADYRPSYREADAKDAWGHLLDWFKKHGVA